MIMPALRARGSKSLMDKLISRINRRKPRNAEGGTFELMRTSKEVASSVKYTLTTGIRPFDAVTGGFSFGRVAEVYGLDASGKSGLVQLAAARAQMRHIYERVIDDDGMVSWRQVDDANVYVLYIDNEQSLHEDDKNLINGHTLDIMLGRCDTIDQMFMMIDEVIDGVAAEENDTGRPAFVVVIVDTIAGTASKEEMTQEWGKDDYTRQPKQLRQGFRKITRKIARQNVCVICTNQVSDRFDVARGHGPKYSTPQDGDFSTFGGRALKYYASLRIFMFSMKQKFKLNERTKGTSGPDGLVIGFRTTKNRLVKPFREGRMVLLFGRTSATPNYQPKDGEKPGGYHDIYSLLETFIQLGLAEADGKSITFKFSTFGIETTTFQGSSLEDDDDDGPKRHPKITTRGEWLPFYEAHREDFERMWGKATELMFSTEVAVPQSDDLDDDEPVEES